MKIILLLTAFFVFTQNTNAQLLKKLKEKVNKTINKDGGGKVPDSGNNAGEDNASLNKISWCDTINVSGTGSYSKVYSSEDKMNVVYTECSVGLENDPSGYRLILSGRVNGKQQFVVVENGQVVDTDDGVKSKYLAMADNAGRPATADPNSWDDQMKKYIVPDSSKLDVPKINAGSATMPKIDDDQYEMTFNIARQTDEYKNLSTAEKKEFEENLKIEMEQAKKVQGKTFSFPAQQGAAAVTIVGYKLIIKGKNFGKFILPPAVQVSKDETNFFAVGMDDKGAPVMVTQAKKVPMDKTRFAGNGGAMLKSSDKTKVVYLEQRQLTQKELQGIMDNAGDPKKTYNVLRKDGSVLQVTDYSGSSKFKLTNAGAIISIDETTGDVYSNNKSLGKFNLSAGERLESETVLIGAGPSSIAYFNGSDGSLNYLDGTSKKLGMLFPTVSAQDGKTYLSWFRKCKNDYYLGKLAF